MTALRIETSTQFDDVETILGLVQRNKASLKSDLTGNPYNALLYRALGKNSPLYAYYDHYNNLDFYAFLESTEQMLNEDPSAVIGKLQSIQAYFDNRTNAVAGYAGSADGIAANAAAVEAFFAARSATEIEPVAYSFETPADNEALIVDSSVQFNLIVGDYADKYNGECGIERGVMLAVYPDSCQLCTKEDYGNFVREALGIRRGGNLSNTSLEVLAIIAYNQPVTRVYIDTVRGVDSSYTVSSLFDKGLIEPCGRLDVPGHPRLYRTTENFLRVFGLSSLSDLPAVSRDDILGEGLTEISGQYTIKTELAGEETGGGETE